MEIMFRVQNFGVIPVKCMIKIYDMFRQNYVTIRQNA